MTVNKLGLGWKGALAAALVASACGKVADEHGGESHFYCAADDDCTGDGQVCVRTRPSDERGVCRPLSEVTGTDDAGGIDSGVAGGSSSGGRSNVGAGGATGTGTGGTPPSNFGGTGGGPIVLGECGQACCPRDESCYATPQGSFQSGRECMALRENTGADRIQLRHTSTKTLLPTGLAFPVIQNGRNSYTHLPLDGQNGTPNCFGAGAAVGGRFIQLLDIRLDGSSAEPSATSGFSRLLRKETIAGELEDGLCTATGDFLGDPSYRLDSNQMSDSSGYPAGLTPPRGLADSPWSVEAVNYLRLDADFEPSDREGLLAKGGRGSYFYDPVKGRFHAYTPLLQGVQYSPGSEGVPLVIPLREVRTTLTFNDPLRPNCVGAVFSPDVTVPGCNQNDAWIGLRCLGDGTCEPRTGSLEQGFGENEGYMLITELEQVFEPSLRTTLCVAVMSATVAEESGWLSADRTSCKSDKWDPQAPNNEGLPPGDWCAASNGPATPTCHDAFALLERTTYSATKVKIDPVTNYPAACPID